MDNTSKVNVTTLLAELSTIHPNRPAIIDSVVNDGSSGFRMKTYADLEKDVHDAACRLAGAGVRPLDVVLIYVPLQAELIALLLAVFRLGAQALFIDPTYSPDKVWHCIKLAKPNHLIVDRRLRAIALTASAFRATGLKSVLSVDTKECGALGTSIDIIRRSEPQTLPKPYLVAPDHPALITFTSGSTGKPKGIVRSHSFLINQSPLLQKTLPVAWKDPSRQYNVMTALPMFVLAALAAGQTAVIPASNDITLLHQLKYLLIDRILAAPGTVRRICGILKEHNLNAAGLKEIIVGGGPVFPTLLAEIKETFPAAKITTVYGSTEAEPICHHTCDYQTNTGCRQAKRGLLLGKPIDKITLSIIDTRMLRGRTLLSEEEFAALNLPAGKEGEIIVAGDHVVKSYLGGQGETETKLNVGGRIYHRTGDAGYVDNEGCVFLTGRVAYGVETGGGIIYPLSVELQAMEIAGVERCAFLASGIRSVLALQLRGGCNQVWVLARLRQKFAAAGISIDKYVVVSRMPMDERHQSKIAYAKLKRRLRLVS